MYNIHSNTLSIDQRCAPCFHSAPNMASHMTWAWTAAALARGHSSGQKAEAAPKAEPKEKQEPKEKKEPKAPKEKKEPKPQQAEGSSEEAAKKNPRRRPNHRRRKPKANPEG